MGHMKNLAIDVEQDLIAALNRRGDDACTAGDEALRDGLYTAANTSYLHAARFRRAAIALRDGKPVRHADAQFVTKLRTRIEQITLIATEVVAEIEAEGTFR